MKARTIQAMWVPILTGMLIFAAGSAQAEHEVDYRALKQVTAKLVGQASELSDYGDRNFHRGHRSGNLRNNLRDFHECVHEFQEKVDYYADHRVRGAKQVDELFRFAAITREQLRYVHNSHRATNMLAGIQATLDQLHYIFAPPVVVRLDWDRVQSVAHEIDELSRHIYEQSRRERSFHPSPFFWMHRSGRERALDRLDDLKDEANHLHKIVEKGRIDLKHIDGDFRDVVEAYNRAGTRINAVSYVRRREFERLGRTIAELEAILYAPQVASARPGYSGDRGRRDSYDPNSRNRNDGGRWSSGRRSNYL